MKQGHWSQDSVDSRAQEVAVRRQPSPSRLQVSVSCGSSQAGNASLEILRPLTQLEKKRFCSLVKSLASLMLVVTASRSIGRAVLEEVREGGDPLVTLCLEGMRMALLAEIEYHVRECYSQRDTGGHKCGKDRRLHWRPPV